MFDCWFDALCREEKGRGSQGESAGGDLCRQLSICEQPPGEGAGRGALRCGGGAEAAQGLAGRRQRIVCRSFAATSPYKCSGRLLVCFCLGYSLLQPCSLFRQLFIYIYICVCTSHIYSMHMHEMASRAAGKASCFRQA